MRRQQEEELRRLEQALLEDNPEEDSLLEEDPLEWVEAFYEDGEEGATGFTVHNTDDTDVDLDDYSEEVYQAKRGGCLIPGLITVLALCALTAMVLWLLNYLGVMRWPL